MNTFMVLIVCFFAGSLGQEKATWNQLKLPGPEARIDHKMGTHANGYSAILYAGWSIINNADFFYGDVWRLNFTSSMAWEKLGNTALDSARADSGVGVLSHGAFVFGGMLSDFSVPTDTLFFDFATKKYSVAQANAPLQGRYGHSTVTIPGTNDALVFAGSFNDGSTTNELWTYFGGNQTWIQMKTAVSPPARMWHTAAMVDKDTLVIYGGQSWSNAKTFFGDIWAYSVSKNTWTQLTGTFPNGIPGTRTGGAAVGCNGKFYIMGGQTSDQKCANNFWVYNTHTSTWSVVASTNAEPETRCSTKGTFVRSTAGKNYFFIFGGCIKGCSQIINEAWTAQIQC